MNVELLYNMNHEYELLMLENEHLKRENDRLRNIISTLDDAYKSIVKVNADLMLEMIKKSA